MRGNAGRSAVSDLTGHKVGAVFFCCALFCLLCLIPSKAYASACPAGGDHNYVVSIAQYATETEDGIRLFGCNKCGSRYEQVIPSTGHQWGPWVIEIAPTCISEGREQRICTKHQDNIHHDYRIVAPLSPAGSHDYVMGDNKPATCTEVGYRTYACSICGDPYREEDAAQGHDWSEWTIDREPTTTSQGSKKRTCLRDGSHVEYVEIAALPVEESPVETKEEEVVLVAPEEDEPDPFLSGPNAFDAVVLGIDFVVLLVLLIFVIPLAAQLRWVREKRKDARRSLLAQLAEEKDAK